MKAKPLTNLQMELLKLYSTDLDEKELIELKNIIAGYYAKKAIKAADEIYINEQLTDKDMDNWLHES